MKVLNKETGQIGEALAEKLLKEKGYEILERNFSTRFGEIDRICRDGGILVFVEVKTKKGGAFGMPEEMFTRGKAAKVKRMATLYLQGKEVPCRIDMVAIVLNEAGRPDRITHYENVVL